MTLFKIPRNLAIGDIIAYATEQLETEDGLKRRFTFAGSEYFERMKKLNLYVTNKKEIENKIKRMNLINIYKEKLI